MTYQIGNTVVASDYMSLRGENNVDVAYSNDTAATGKAAALIGVGFGQRGYGQTATALGNVAVDGNVTVTEWNQLRSVMSTLNDHTSSGLTLQPIVYTGNIILAQDGSAGRVNIQSILYTLDYNRLNVNPTEMSLSSAGINSSRTTSWTTSVYHEFTATFATENDARYFFNSGGEIRTSGTRTGGGTGQMNKNVSAMLNQMGSVRFGATATRSTGTGTGSAGTNIGYYGLTANYQPVFVHAGAGGIYTYTNISYTLTARRESYLGANGANGALLRFQATFSLGGYPGVTADGILTSIVSNYSSTGVISVTSPTYVTVIGIGP